MILLKKILLAFFGLCAGGVIAAGVYAFLAIIGVFVRLMGKTGTRKHIFLYETVIILGGVLGNILDIYEFPIYMGPYIGTLFICVFGLSVGIFVGCLALAIAEMLNTIPIFARRIQFRHGLGFAVLSVALGKMVGSLIYFSQQIFLTGG